ncbi:hypothetical protein CR513_16601, partial [Mucuna pruriens]
MTRFLRGLNKEIQDIVELHDYTSLSTLVRQGTKVEHQLKRHGRRSYHNTSCSWKGKEKIKYKPRRDKVNVASLRLMEKLSIPTLPHPKSYKLQWLSERGEMICDKQVSLAITLGKYKDEILCDMVLMEETHPLLGRP